MSLSYEERPAPPRPGEPGYLEFIRTVVRNQLVWKFGRPVRARGKILDDLIRLEREAAWNEALDHVWQLSDPANTVVQTRSRREVLVDSDIRQAKEENPYG